MGLVLDEVLIQGEAVHVDKDPFNVVLVEPGSLEVRISEAALAAFLNKKAPGGLSDFQVTMLEGYVRVEAKASIIISKVDVAAVCKLRIEEGAKLFVDLVRVEAIGGTGAHNIVQRQLDGINPVIDVDHLPVQATLTSVESDHHWLVVLGTIAPKSK
jgi:hypothetical protein